MTMLGMTFEQAVASFGWGNVRDFARNLPQQSATWRALHGEAASFGSGVGQSAVLADIYDAIAAFAHMFAKAHGGKGDAPRPYPRPGAKDGGERIGKEPIPAKDFDDWYYGGE